MGPQALKSHMIKQILHFVILISTFMKYIPKTL